MFAVEIVTVIGSDVPFFPSTDKELKFRPDEVVKNVAKKFPTARITQVIEHRLHCPEFSKVADLRRVLFHRGTLPRSIRLSLGGPDIDVDAIPSNPADPAEQWRYDFYLEPEMLDGSLAWCDNAAAETIDALDEFTTGW